jgi:hypothetical protein
VGDGGGDFAAAGRGEVAEQGIANPPAEIRKGVSIEKQERRGFVLAAQEVEGFEERKSGQPDFFPADLARASSLWISAVLRSTSCARSSVEADDSVPTPVFEKLGSGL